MANQAVENELLLLTACEVLGDDAKKRLEQVLASQSVNWPHLLRLATDHGTYPLLSKHLGDYPDYVPAKVLSDLRQSVDANEKKNFLFAAELIKLKVLLDANGIEFMTYKGPSLALQAFGHLANRVFTDLDIIVNRTQVAQVQNLLLAANYTPEPDSRKLLPAFMNSSLFRKLTFEQTFARRPEVDLIATSVIDIHWEVAPPYVLSFDFETLKKNSITIDFLGRTLQTFRPEFLIVVLCCHGTKHQWLYLRWIADIASIIQRHPNLNWQEMYDLARRFGVAAKLDLALILCRELPGFCPSIPSEVLDRIEPLPHRFEKIRHQTLQSWFEPGVQNHNLRLYWYYELATFDRFVHRANFAIHELIEPGLPTYLRFPLPAALFGLYYFIHPLLTLFNFLCARLRCADLSRKPFTLSRWTAIVNTNSIAPSSNT
jgi:hypothetical protein